MSVDLKTIDEEIKVWYALRTAGRNFSNPYDALYADLTGWNRKTVVLPTRGKVELVESTISEETDRYIIFSTSADEKIYRMDSDDNDSWESGESFYSPYEVVSKVVTETKFVRL